MGYWFEYLLTTDCLILGYLLENVNWKIQELFKLTNPLHVLLLIASLLLAVGLSIIAYMDWKDSRTKRKQKDMISDIFKLILTILLIFGLVYLSWFFAKLIIVYLMKDKVNYPNSPLFLFLSVIIISFPLIFYSKFKETILKLV